MSDQAGYRLATLIAELADVGLMSGRDVLVHCSMRALGLGDNGPETVYRAVRSVIGDAVSVVVPTHTAINSSTSSAYRAEIAGLDDVGLAEYEARREGFDPAVTPSYGMGQLAEFVRRNPAARRSSHPQTSFSAVGPDANAIVGRHDLNCHLGEDSPLGALYRLDATILLLGVGYDTCTAFHLAEYRLPWPPEDQEYRCYVSRDGHREELTFTAARLDPTDFSELGANLEEDTAIVAKGPFGAGTARAMPMRGAVDFAVGWMSSHRHPSRTAVS